VRLLAAAVAISLLLSACGVLVSEGESKQLAGPAWTGQGKDGMSQAEAEAFRDFALYWWGPEFAGFNLQTILKSSGQVTLLYGTCTIPRGRDGGCAVPLQIMIQPLCALAPQVARQAYPEPDGTLREGALLMRRYIPERSEATATFWTGDAVVRVSVGAAPVQFDEALGALQGLNSPIGPAASLPAPDFQRCA